MWLSVATLMIVNDKSGCTCTIKRLLESEGHGPAGSNVKKCKKCNAMDVEPEPEAKGESVDLLGVEC